MIDASEVKVALRAHRASALAAGNSDPGLANPIDRAHIASTAIFNATALMPGEMDGMTALEQPASFIGRQRRSGVVDVPCLHQRSGELPARLYQERS